VKGRNFICLIKGELQQVYPAFPEIIHKKTAWFSAFMLKYSYNRLVYTHHILTIIQHVKKNNNPSVIVLVMNHPPPHSFSRSPVEEVFCSCMRTSGAEALSLTIPPPYPGWPHIREKIKDMVMGAGEISHINGCLLRYSDLIPFSDGKNLPGTEEIAHLISGIYQYSFDSTQNEIILIDTKIPDTIGSVQSIHDSPGKPGWTLIFTVNTERPVRFGSVSSILNWFDDARAGIHEIFDLIVPEEIVQALK